MIENLLVAVLAYLAFFLFEIGVEHFYEVDYIKWIVSHSLCILNIFSILLILN